MKKLEFCSIQIKATSRMETYLQAFDLMLQIQNEVFRCITIKTLFQLLLWSWRSLAHQRFILDHNWWCYLITEIVTPQGGDHFNF